jgi:chromosome partitioning protein
MTKPVLTFFNNKGGVGKTTLVYHVSHMLAQMGVGVLVVDCDPQSNLSSAFLEDDELQQLWDDATQIQTIYRAVRPLIKTMTLGQPVLQKISQHLHLIVGDLGLSSFEDQLSEEWNKALSDKPDAYERAFSILTGFWRCAQEAATRCEADVIIFDIGPNLGAINRSVLIGTDHIVIPLGADLFSLRGLRNMGPALKEWQTDWKRRTENKPFTDFALPQSAMQALGYVAMQHQERLSRPVHAYRQWIDRIPEDYRHYILGLVAADDAEIPAVEADPHALALLRHYKSLIPIAQEARKPIFSLKTADGVSGSQLATVRAAYDDFRALALRILTTAKLQHLVT